MKRLNSEKKRLIIGIIALLLIVTMIFSMVAPFVYGANQTDDNTGISIKAQVGFNGNFKVSKVNPFRINIENNSNNDFKGEVQVPILIEPYSNEYNIISKKIELPPNSSKYVNLEAKIPYIQKNFEVNIVNNNGKIIKSKKIPVKPSSPTEIWAGVLSDTYENTLYLNPSYFNSTGYIFSLNEQASENASYYEEDDKIFNSPGFVPNEYNISSLNVIVIDNFNTSSLSEEWKNSIKKWIENGGIIVVGTGINKDKITKGFPELFSDSYGVNVSNLESNMLTMNINKNDEEENFIYNSTHLKKAGKGYIIIYDFDLSKNFSNSNLFTSQFNSLYDFAYYNTSEQDSQFEENLVGYTNRMPNFNDDVIKLIFFIIFFYALFIGPILYIILRKKDKRDSALKLIPLISFSITIIIYSMSFNTIYKKPIGNAISYTNLDLLSNNTYISDIAVNLITPDKGDLQIDFDNKIHLENISNVDYNYGYNSAIDATTTDDKPKSYILKTNLDENVSITRFNTSKWSKNYISMSKEISFEGGIDFDFNIRNDFLLEGVITNNTGYDLEDVIVGINQTYQKVEKFPNGTEIKLGEDGVKIKIDNSETANFEDILTNGMRNKNTGEATVFLERQYQLESRQDILSNIIYNVNSQELSFKLNFIAFNSNKIIDDDIKINKKNPIMNTTNIFYASNSFSIKDFTTKEIPYGFIESSINEYTNNISTISKGNSNTIDLIDFENPFETDFMIPLDFEVEKFKISWNTFNGYNEIYNFNTNSWEPLSTNEYSGNNISYYISESNRIDIRTSELSGYTIEIPKIKLTLK